MSRPSDRASNPDLLANSPPWVREVLKRMDEHGQREQERAEMAHRGANKMAAALTKVEANGELTRQEVLGVRADFVRVERLLGEMEARLNQRVDDLETRMEKRLVTLEERVGILEVSKL